MTNSDYLIKATVKKISEKFNQTFTEKIEEATTAAQEIPEIIKKELEILKEEIIEEAERMKNKVDKETATDKSNISKNDELDKSSSKIKEINNLLKNLNKRLNN